MSTTTTEEIDLAELQELRKAHDQIREQMARQIVGQNDVVEQLLMAVFAPGHCILEGVPGLAKTVMVHSLAQSLRLAAQVVAAVTNGESLAAAFVRLVDQPANGTALRAYHSL